MRRKPSCASNPAAFLVAVAAAALLWSCSQPPQPAPRNDEPVDWNRYYSNDETNAIMQRYAARFPRLTRIYPIGKSYRGVDLMLMEVTNHESGPAEEKPGFYVDGNIHAGELTGSAVTLYLMGYLLEGYGKNPEVTELVDSKVFYLRPKFNPDGADLSLLKDISLRSSVRPIDEDGDGQADEDPAEDLNADGFITQMRIPDPDGTMKVSAEDPRLMERREPGETGGTYYRIGNEGIDNDRDGRLNEDGIGGLDLNRNFPRNWEPEYMQPGAGPFPLSEPETYATIRFIDAHPNITGIVHNHTSGGFVYRLPSASDPTKFDRNDLALIETLGARYTETTGRRVIPSATDPVKHRYGTLISWAYWDRGIIGWVPEYWPGISADTDGDGETSELERLRYNDEHLGGKYFVDWKPYDHPDLGRVEIGGWKRRFVSQNPPPELLEKECALQIPWIVYLASRSPKLSMTGPRVTGGADGRYEVEITVENSGFLPTNLTERGLEAKLVAPLVAVFTAKGATLIEGGERTELGHLAGSYRISGKERRASATARWIVHADSSEAAVQVTVISEKGGTLRSAEVPLK